MGKRKSSKPPPKKQRPKLDVSFSCPFCNSDKSVTATMDWNNEVRPALHTREGLQTFRFVALFATVTAALMFAPEVMSYTWGRVK